MKLETCCECKRQAPIGTEIGFYVFPKGIIRPLCQPHTRRDCAEKRYAKLRAWLEGKTVAQKRKMIWQPQI